MRLKCGQKRKKKKKKLQRPKQIDDFYIMVDLILVWHVCRARCQLLAFEANRLYCTALGKFEAGFHGVGRVA